MVWMATRPNVSERRFEGPLAQRLTAAESRVVVQTLEVEPIRDLEVTTYHAASTAFQISGAVLFLTRSWPSLN
jgi:hypothetical protein